MRVREVMVLAGEASGDLHGAGLAEALRRIRPDVHVVGMGGHLMREAGVELIEDVERMSVMGFVEVLRSVPHHYAVLRLVEQRLITGRVGLLVVIDYPGFNMKAAAVARRLGIPVLYYITPQVWAWGAGRLPKLARLITKAATILPFEAPLLQAHGIDATFVGHPLLDRAAELPSREEARRRLGLSPDRPMLALFPGSRQQEVDRHLAAFSETAERLVAQTLGLQVVVSAARNVRLDSAVCRFPLIEGASFDVLRAADAALCKSGTTTLEAAVAGCPLIVAYRTNAITHAIARRLVRIPHIGLVNVVAGREIAPEFVQDRLTADAMTPVLAELLPHESPRRLQMVRELEGVRDQLGTAGAAGRTAEMAAGMLT